MKTRTPERPIGFKPPASPGCLGWLHQLPAWCFTLAMAALLTLSARAVTVTINPPAGNTPTTFNYWAGVGTTNVLGVGSNLVTFASADTSTANLAVSGLPAGLTAVLTTNAITNSTSVGLNLFATNVAAGYYPLTISSSGNSAYTTNVNFFVVPEWITTNAGASGNWSTAANWSGGAVPSSTSSVLFEHQLSVTSFTNVVDTTRAIQDLIILGDADDNSGTVGMNTFINSGVTFSVLGTNGFVIGNKANNSCRPDFLFSGAGALVVSNPVANFAVSSGASAARIMTVNMTNLNTLAVTVNRFGAGDSTLTQQGLYGGALVNFFLAKTNTIIASYTDTYTAPIFQNSFQYQAEGDIAGSGTVVTFNLGITNGFFMDSLGVARSKAPGSGGVTINGGGDTFRFATCFTNETAPFSSAYFRNTNGGRMSLIAVGVDSGTNSANNSNNKGSIDLRGGVADVLVDQMWLGQNRIKATTPIDAGAFIFDWGKVNANTVLLGNMVYTNGASVNGFLSVGSNGVMTVNKYIGLGFTPTNTPGSGFEPNAAFTMGQIQVNGGGTLLANTITTGSGSATNGITVASGGLLLVSNTIAEPGLALTTLSLDNAQLTFFVKAGSTNAFVTNLTTTVNASHINIASLSGFTSFPATNVLISYQNSVGAGSHNIGIGTLPAGYNNMQIVDDPINQVIDLVISTNAPKNLAWRGFQNAQWDHSSTNWINLALNAPTNVTKFTDGDSVTFDDTAAVPVNITIAENVLPGQTGTGITVSNSINKFVFNSSGSGDIGACVLAKAGTAGLEIDPLTSLVLSIANGNVTVGGSGSIANATIGTGTILTNSGAVSGGITCSGFLQNQGTVAGALSILASGTVNNSAAGTANGSLSMQSGAFLNNVGLMNAIGTSTEPTNCTIINAGAIYGTSLTINGTLQDVVPGSAGVSQGSLNLGTLAINGTFMPGGNTIATTKVTDYANDNQTQLGNPNGRVQLNSGSTTILQVNLTATPPYTKILSQNQGFGPSQAARGVNGGTLLITNEGTVAFAAGQTFKFFGQYYNDGNINGAGLNTTNAYPIIVPNTPGPGLAWDRSQLIPGGIIGIKSASADQVVLTNNVTFANGTNIIIELTWPASFNGVGWLQQQVNTISNGLGTNWSNIAASDYVNDIIFTNTVSANAATFYRFVVP